MLESSFENKIIRNMYASQYIAAWYNIGGKNNRYYVKNDARSHSDFKDWLESLIIDGEHLTDDEIRYIDNLRSCGRLELEEHAKRFINSRGL